MLGGIGLAAFTVAQDTSVAQYTEIAGLVICTSAVAQDAQTKQALKIQVGSATRGDVEQLMGKPWRTSNDADCDAEQYGETWEYSVEEAIGKFSRIHVAFDKDGKVSAVAKIPQGGKPVVLAYVGGKEHQH
jgi:hypothetical protein